MLTDYEEYNNTETSNNTEATITTTRRPLLQKSKSIDVCSILPRPLKMVTPAPFKRSRTIDGSNCSPSSRPATRRMRTIQINDEGCCKGDFVYVGPNPVIKKTTNMLRRPYKPTNKKTTSVVSKKRQQQQQQQKKLSAKSASKTDLKQCRSTRVGRSRRSSLTGSSSCNKNSAEIPRAPRRKKSNPFLQGGLVGQSSLEASTIIIQPNRSSSSSRSLSPMMTTRSQARYQQKECNPFLLDGLVGQSSSSPIMTRSRSRQRLQANLSLGAPRVPSRKASVDDMHMEYTSTSATGRSSNVSSFIAGAAPRVPSRKQSMDDMHISMVYPAATNTAPSMPRRKASNPFLSTGLVVHGPLANEDRIIMTRSRSRQKLQSDKICMAPSRKASIPDFQWDKLSLSDNTTQSKNCASPIFPMRKASAMVLNGVAA